MSEQLRALSKPFDARLVEKKPGKGNLDYVSHSVVTERALATLGPFSLHTQEVIYRDGKVDGVLVTLECEIDGKTVRITEAGEGDNPTAKTNGALLKDAISDAVKRCFMRVGLGLHLWSQELYVLDRVLEKRAKDAAPQDADVRPVEAPQPAQEPAEQGIGEKRGRELLKHLTGLGLKVEEQLKLLDRVTQATRSATRVEPGDLTEDELRRVLGVAKRETKPVYETWESDEKAQEWGGKSGAFSGGGHLLMLAWDENKAHTGRTGLPGELYRNWFEHVTGLLEQQKQKAA